MKLNKFILMFIGLLGMVTLTSSYAGVEVHEFTDPDKAARYKILVDELRCLVCQNQNLADSNAELARDLRQQVYEMINDGKSKDEIVNYMVARYGDFVLYRPPLKKITWLLWFGPIVMILLGFLIVFLFVRNIGKNKSDEISEAEQQDIREMLQSSLPQDEHSPAADADPKREDS